MTSPFPTLLLPSGVEPLILPGGQAVDVPKSTPNFLRWSGPAPRDTYGGKPVLDLQGEIVFAELKILRLFQAAGWGGAWVDTYKNRLLTGYWPTPVKTVLPNQPGSLLDRLRKRVGRSGCWDVFLWRDDSILFAEAKREGKDRMRPSQLAFLEAALAEGLPLSSFLVVEWSVRR